METVTVSTQLAVMHCGGCGGTYGIDNVFRDKKYENGGGWHCPYCQIAWGYFGETEAQKLKKELEREKANAAFYKTRRDEARAEAEHFRKSRDGIKGALVKVQRRVKHGVCPCCHRKFKALEMHIKNKHPEFATEEPSA